MSLHDDLRRQAWHLATREPRRPVQASLRRAVSAAYYLKKCGFCAWSCCSSVVGQPSLFCKSTNENRVWSVVRHRNHIVSALQSGDPQRSTEHLCTVGAAETLRTV